MAEFAANFSLNNNSIDAQFDLSEGAQFDALFEIYAAGTVWGTITGELSNQTDLQAALDLKANKTELNTAIQNEATTRAENDTLLQGSINTLSQTVTANYNALDGKIDTEISDRTAADTTLQNNIDAEALARQNADTTLQGNIDTLSDTVSDNDTAINNKVDGINTTLTNSINSLSNTVTSNYNSLDARITTNTGNIATNAGNITTINSKIPNQASSSNQLADKDFVNSSIATNTANFIGTFNSVAELEAYTGTLTNNDYAFVATTDAVGNTLYDRYKYNADTQEWLFEYELNNSSFTAAQWASINSGATSTNIGQITTNANNIANLQTNKQDVISDLTTIRSNALAGKNASDTIATYGNIVTHNVSEFATSSQGALADTALQPNDNISELTNDVGYITSASLPTVNNGTLTIQANGTTVGTFTANQAGNTTANIVVPDSATWGNITGTLSNQTDLQNALDAKYDASNPEGYITNADLPTNYVTTDTEQTVTGFKTLTNGLKVTKSNAGAILELESAASGTYFLLVRTNGAQCVLESGNALGLFGTKSNHPLQIRTNYTNRMTIGTDGSVTLATDVATNSNDNQVATTKWVNNKGYLTSNDLTNYVTTNTAQDISGRKTFLGEKAIYFKQSATTNKLGFTLYNPSNSELGALEYRPSTINGSALLAINCPQTTGNYVGFRYWGTPAINIVAPKPTTAGDYYIATHITDGTNTVTANSTGTVDISTLLPTVPTKTSDLTNDSGYITDADLPDVSNFANKDLSNLTSTGNSKFQVPLESGTNIKTINNQSILGSGDITINEPVLYSITGQNTDGAMTQEASTLLMKYSNIRIQGAISLQDNTLSGFGENAFATVPKNFSPQSDPWEIVVNFKYIENTSGNQTIFDINDGFNRTRPLTCYVNHNTNKLRYGLSSTTSNNSNVYDILTETDGTHTLVDDTVYWLKFEFTGSAYNFYISTDGTTWESDLTVTSSTAIYSDKPIVFGLYRTEQIAPLLGEIYLENCYININGNRWWDGVKIVSNLDDIRTAGVAFAETPYNIFRWAMPSSTRYDLSIPASGSTVTASHDGWAGFVYRTSTSGSFMGVANTTRQVYSYASQSANNQLGRVYIPVLKGDIIRVEYTSSGTNTAANALFIMRGLGGR